MKRLFLIITLVLILDATLIACQSETVTIPTVNPQPTVSEFSPTAEPTQAPTATATTVVEPTPTFTLTQTASPSSS